MLRLVFVAAAACGTGAEGGLDAPGDAGTGVAPDATTGVGAGDGSVTDAGDAGELDGTSPDGAGGDGGQGPRCPVEVTPEPGLVVTEAGAVQGEAFPGGEGFAYLGIPYVAPPVGPRRWRAPEPAPCFDGVFDARTFSAECPQYGDDGGIIGDEDCLGLNVWTPAVSPRPDQADLRPVLFWIHGGGHEQGSGSRAVYDGTPFARDRDVVVVTFNYRLGPLGFLAHPDLDAPDVPSGNYGMRDQLAALTWVHDNIRAFGGDPERVMIFGQSAGSVSTCRLLVSPPAAGMFSAAVLQSGGCVATAKDRAEQTGRRFAEDAGCPPTVDARACLAERSAAELIAAFDRLESGANSVGLGTWSGVIDGVMLPEAPRDLIAAGRHHRVPVIVGSTREENGREAPPIQTEAQYEETVRTLYAGLPEAVLEAALAAYPVEDYASPRAAYVALTSDGRFTCGARRDATLLAESQSEPVYRYLFAHTADNGSAALTALGAWHGIELFFVFGTLETSTPLASGPGDDATTAAVQSAWTALAQGRSVGEQTGWPEWDGTRLRLFDAGFTDVDDPRAETCDFWDGWGL